MPQLHGEDKYAVMLGPLHIEMAGLKMIGEFLEGCDWCIATAQANVASEGTADSFIHALHVAKTRWAHHVTATSLYILQRRAFAKDLEISDTRDPVPEMAFTKWCEKMCFAHPMFSFWSLVLDPELPLPTFIRAFWTSDFELFTESLGQLAPWFFAWIMYTMLVEFLCTYVT